MRLAFWQVAGYVVGGSYRPLNGILILDSHAMPIPEHEEEHDHDVIPAPQINWKLIGFGALSLLVLNMVAHGNAVGAIVICALAAVGLLLFR